MRRWTILLAVFAWVNITHAAQSTNYKIEEDFIGGGGLIEESSANFTARESIGDLGIGESASTNFQTQGGYTTTNDPTLTFVVNTSSINFGSLSTAATATATSSFRVLNYTSYGYVVLTIGSPPSNGSHTLAAMSSTGPSVVGTEQYGINLRANTSPISFGADPVQVPSGSFSFGSAAANYNSPNNYRYVAGESIATATKTSGRTDYTISYIVNSSTTTPGGTYTGAQSLVVVGTY